MSLKQHINNGDLDGIMSAIAKDPSKVNQIIKWGPLFKNQVHPLHYLCDRVFSGELEDETASQIASFLIENGANINGYGFEELKDTPLVAAASLHADEVAMVLIEAGADIHHGGCLGGTALHWAAWCGRERLVKRLLEEELDIDRRCIAHASTAFFWAAHGRASSKEKTKQNQIECAKLIRDAGADLSIPNMNGTTAKELLKNDEEFLNAVFLTE
jgi:ankyrin repeat protein